MTHTAQAAGHKSASHQMLWRSVACLSSNAGSACARPVSGTILMPNRVPGGGVGGGGGLDFHPHEARAGGSGRSYRLRANDCKLALRNTMFHKLRTITRSFVMAMPARECAGQVQICKKGRGASEQMQGIGDHTSLAA